MRISTFLIASLLIATAYSAAADCTSANVGAATCSEDCLAAGFTQANNTGACVAPTDCTTGSKCGGANAVVACQLLGYKVADACVAPVAADCATGAATLNYCQNTYTQCVALGFSKKTADNSCQAPTDCKAANAGNCATGKTACTNLGYSKPDGNDCICAAGKLDNNNACTVPVDADCKTAVTAKALCGDASYTCVATLGYVKKGDDDFACMVPADCKAANAGNCATGKVACTGAGYAKGTGNDCVCDTVAKTDASNTCTAKTPVANCKTALTTDAGKCQECSDGFTLSEDKATCATSSSAILAASLLAILALFL